MLQMISYFGNIWIPLIIIYIRIIMLCMYVRGIIVYRNISVWQFRKIILKTSKLASFKIKFSVAILQLPTFKQPAKETMKIWEIPEITCMKYHHRYRHTNFSWRRTSVCNSTQLKIYAVNGIIYSMVSVQMNKQEHS